MAWLHDTPARERAEKVNGAIGELSDFRARNGYYPEGISLDTASLPAGWQDRAHGWPLVSSNPANARFLDKHDLVVSKLVAFRAKDLEFVAALVETDLVEPDIIRERIALLPDQVTPVATQRILSWLDSLESHLTGP